MLRIKSFGFILTFAITEVVLVLKKFEKWNSYSMHTRLGNKYSPIEMLSRIVWMSQIIWGLNNNHNDITFLS